MSETTPELVVTNGKHDVWTHRLVAVGTIVITLGCVGGVVWQHAMGLEVTQGLLALGGIGLGALTNMLHKMMQD